MKTTLFSGIQPSGDIHLGNYLGALRNWVELQHHHQTYICVVDLHALTTTHDEHTMHRATLDTAKILIASGVDPKKTTLFVQSHVPAHTQLYWVLNTISKVSELQLMTQYKDKTRHAKDSFAGLFNYPVLMAADILLYNTNIVPIGEDQRQHLEFTRELARRFNRMYEKTFVIPKELIQEEGARIMGLDDPTKKMSKSAESEKSYISLTDTPDVIIKKIQSSVTDSGSDITHSPKKPGISNLLTIYSQLTNRSITSIEKEYKAQSYQIFKADIARVAIDHLEPIQKRYNDLSDRQVMTILKSGAKQANSVAEKNIKRIYKAVGIAK